jgi:abequosyltransferase
MSDARPLLTIAVPTYNRSECLAELLTYLAPQVTRAPGVELLISDNASTDDTTSVVDRFRKEGVALTYIRNDTNLGMDGNFLQCFERAAGKYVWLIGDDDVLLPGGLEVVLALLREADYDLVYVTSYFFEGDFTVEQTRRRTPSVTIDTALEFARRVNVFLTFLSGNIINKDRVISLEHRPFSELAGTKLMQLGWTYTLLKHFRGGLIVREPIIAARAENTGGYGLCQVFGVSLKRITEEWLVDPAMVRVILTSTASMFFPWFLLKTKSTKNAFDRENPHSVLKGVFGEYFQYWLFDYPIIKLARRPAAIWFYFGKILLKVDRYIDGFLFG